MANTMNEDKIKEANIQFFRKNGFSDDGRSWIILGETYSIKDKIKEEGGKFSRELGWHFPYDNRDFKTIEIKAGLVFESINGLFITYKSDLSFLTNEIKKINDRMYSNQFNSKHQGNIGEKLTVQVTLINEKDGYNDYGYYMLYSFKDDAGNVYIWRTTKNIGKEIGDKFTITGTVKAHSEFRTVKQTVLTKCKIS